MRSGSIKWPKRPLYGLSYKYCHFTHSFATLGSIVLPLFTRNGKVNAMRIKTGRKDSFAASKFWNHSFAKKF
jgi:hypothetical protein